jgi:hypothetical protein
MNKILLCVLLLCQNLNAAVTLNNYESLKKKKEAHHAYLFGLGDAYQAVNFYNKKHKIKELFCQPDNLALDPQDYATFIESYINKNYGPKEIAKIPQENQEKYKKLADEKFSIETLDDVLLKELQKAFPCK